MKVELFCIVSTNSAFFSPLYIICATIKFPCSSIVFIWSTNAFIIPHIYPNYGFYTRVVDNKLRISIIELTYYRKGPDAGFLYFMAGLEIGF
jgi:hypothetical protein